MHFLNFFAKKELQQEGRFTYLIKGVTINTIKHCDLRVGINKLNDQLYPSLHSLISASAF